MKNYHCSDDKCEGPTKAEKHPFKTICKFIIPSLYGFYQNQTSPTTNHRPTDPPTIYILPVVSLTPTGYH